MGEPAALRADARACFAAAVAAVEPEKLVVEALARRGAELPERVHVVAVGKAAAAMARGAHRALGGRLAGGVLIAPEDAIDGVPPGVEAHAGGHPIPSASGVRGARAALDLATRIGDGEALLGLISGGGSALATLPPEGVALADLQGTTTSLLRAGATIGELNAVRKHLDRIKGGRLGAAAAPAPVIGLVLSDVVGDPLDVIASGPLCPDPTTYADAVEVLRRRGIWETAPASVRRHLARGLAGDEPESPGPEDPRLAAVELEIVGSNRLAVAAAAAEAERRGYRTLVLTTTLVGEAREAGAVLAAIARECRATGRPVEPPTCLLAAGETTVTVEGTGRGGRNQELALGAALHLEGLERVLVASYGTDGIDGPTDAGGAVADGSTVERARAVGLHARLALENNDAYPFFQGLDDLLITGPTGTNVMDIALVFVAGS